MAKKPNGRGFLQYRAYNFKDKDPQIDELRSALEQRHKRRVDYQMLKETEANGGPTVSCMAGWFFKDTKSPFNKSLEAAGRANGFRRKWIRDTDLD